MVLPFSMYLRIPKFGVQNLTYWCLCLYSIRTAFTCCCILSWLLIWLWSEVVDPCFIHNRLFTPKLLFVALKQLQTMLWIVDVMLFLINCEQTWCPLWWTQLSHWEMFMQNGEYTAFWYLQLFCYLMQLQFTTSQNEFVEFFFLFFFLCFLDNCRIWVT